jgi:hypothetical protein
MAHRPDETVQVFDDLRATLEALARDARPLLVDNSYLGKAYLVYRAEIYPGTMVITVMHRASRVVLHTAIVREPGHDASR